MQQLTPEQQKLISREPYDWIYARIGQGVSGSMPAEAILFGRSMTDRELRKCIETMRRAGIVILSSDKGYSLPKSAVELREYVKRTESTAKSVFYTLKGARELLKEMEEQVYGS